MNLVCALYKKKQIIEQQTKILNWLRWLGG